MGYQSINPFNEQLISRYESINREDTDRAINFGYQAFSIWKNSDFKERSERVIQLGKLMEGRKNELAKIMTLEMGKPLLASIAEVEKCIWVCRYYADHAQAFLHDETIETDAAKSYLSWQPLGIMLAIMPWNFPFWQVFRCAAPNLMAGNAIILKHAENVPGCAKAIESLFKDAGFPDCLFQNLYLEIADVESVIGNTKVAAVTLTGSTRAGKSVAEMAGNYLKKTVLELGGSDPYIILSDADVKKAALASATSRMINGGQSCIAAKRFIVHNDIYDRFLSDLTSEMEKYKMGDPLDSETTLGPLARNDLRDNLHRQVLESIKMGATLVIGGTFGSGKGYFYHPTILENVEKGMPAFDEELFGPVASLIRVKTNEEAIEVANDTPYGLGAAIFSENVEYAESLARDRIDAGSCFVNTFVKSDPRLPFGGIKQSGYGRELSLLGIREFMNAKTVYINR